MDFRHLVQSGEYSRDDLNELQNAFIDGEDATIEEIDSALEQLKDELSDSTLDKIIYETCKDFADQLAERIDAKICEDIVVMADENIVVQENEQQQEEPVGQNPEVQQLPELQQVQPQRSRSMRRVEPVEEPVQMTVQPTSRYGRYHR